MKPLEHIDINAALVEGLTDSGRAHLAACPECKQSFEVASGTLASLKSMGPVLERVPDSFWQAQQRAIRVGAAERKPKSSMTAIYAWAGATAAAAVVVVSLIPMHTNTVTPNKVAQQTEISDAALLESVQEQLDAYPEAIHPAQVMYSEMASAQAASSVPTKRK